MDGTLVAKHFFRRSIANVFFVVHHNGFVWGGRGVGRSTHTYTHYVWAGGTTEFSRIID